MKLFRHGGLMSALLLPALSMFTGVLLAAESGGLSEKEQAAGWKLLFDGKSLNGWRSYKAQDKPKPGWTVDEGILKKKKGVPGGDLMTVQTFGDFDLEWDWRVEPGGNNGLKYFITEERGSAIGHEYQLIDDAGHPDGRMGAKRTTASFYDVLPPDAKKPLNPPGQWNHSRVLVQGNHVEHWLNGKKVLEYELGSTAVMDAVQQSKFKTVKGFGTKVRGHVLLTDHQDECWFRQIKIRELEQK
ncbi:MAG TPA: DUF1080 domain-containing protein [Verrucomicrobiae bacterium]|nr:DUF1080 domain-containing protein [Verrucomicrobiae bacterium]